MARIGIDSSILLHGMRAGQRHSRNLIRQLISHYDQDEWRLLYFDRRGITPGRLFPSANGSVREVISRIPIRLLLAPWKTMGFPAVENWIGPIDVYYAPDLYFAPTHEAPVLCTIRGVAYLTIPNLLELKTVSALSRSFAYACKRAHHFLAVSESTRRDLLHLSNIDPERIHVVTHGLDPVFRQLDYGRCRESVARRYGFDKPFLLYVGVIGRHKNVMGILKAYRSAGLSQEGIDLVMAGPFESEIHPAREFVTESRLDKNVHFTGSVGQEGDTLVELYNAAIALVHPSFYEGWGTTPLEAMACGIPVVTSDIPSLREVVQDSALLVQPQDNDALKNAMLKITGDKSCRAGLIEKGLSHVQQHTWERAAVRLRQVLAHVQEVGK